MTQTRLCAFPECRESINDRMLMCAAHWNVVPASLKERIRAAFVVGEEDGQAYQTAARLAVTEARRRWAAAKAVPKLSGLTLTQPMAWAIAAGHKPIENRTRRLVSGLNQPICLHGGKGYEKAWDRDIRQLLGLAGLPPQSHDQGILGVVKFDRCIDFNSVAPSDPMFDCPWFSVPWGWHVAKVLAFPEPIPCPGQRGLWPVPADIAAKVWMRVAIAKAMKE